MNLTVVSFIEEKRSLGHLKSFKIGMVFEIELSNKEFL